MSIIEMGMTEETKGGRSYEVAAAIGRRIASGAYAPGDTLPTEGEIAAALGVGRNAVREAVKMLAGKGLLRTGRRAGTIVQPHDHWNLLDTSLLSWLLEGGEVRDHLLDDLMEMRVLIEPQAAALAAGRATISQTLRIWEAYEVMEENAHTPSEAIDADVLFHRRLFEAAGSQLLLCMFRAVDLMLRENFAIAAQQADAFAANLGNHRAVAEAVQERNPKAAREAMLRLLAKHRDDVDRARCAAE